MLYQKKMGFVGFGVLDYDVLMRPENFTLSVLFNRTFLPKNAIASIKFKNFGNRQSANMRRFNGNNYNS